MIGNVSLWETIPRSLATTFITLLPIASLYLFGGDTLKDFAFALLIGIGSGAYSSIFIAAPLLAWFKEREPEYARRRDDEAPRGHEPVGRRGARGEAAEPDVPAPERRCRRGSRRASAAAAAAAASSEARAAPAAPLARPHGRAR